MFNIRFIGVGVVAATLIVVQASTCPAAIVFSDNWNDQTVQTPVLTSGGDWSIIAGTFTADGTNPGGSPATTHTSPLNQTLTVKPRTGTAIEVNFGNTVNLTPVTATYQLRQADIQTSNNQWSTFLMDSLTAKNVQFILVPNPNAFGSGPSATGFARRFDGGSLSLGVAGTAPTSTDSNFHTIQLEFIPNANPALSVVNAYYDSTLVGNWSVPNGMTRVDTLRLHTSADISFNVDNLTIDATLVPEPCSGLSGLIAAGLFGVIVRRCRA